MQPYFSFDVIKVYHDVKPIALDYSSTHRNIVEKCKRGDRRAQFELYKLYSKAMYNICMRMVKDNLEAEDILQSSFIDIFAKLHTFKYQSSIGAWIKRIVINNCINHLKKRRIFVESLEDHAYKVLEPADPIDQNDDYPWTVNMVKEAMGQLPDGYRVVFNLYAFEGYDHREIAQILDISEATSKSQYSRAKKKLKAIVYQNNSAYAKL